MATTGACLCGEVKYKYTGDVTLKAFCNCKDCQRWGGATGLPNVVVDRMNFQVTAGKTSILNGVISLCSTWFEAYTQSGLPKTFDVVGGSGKINKHFFCGTCGSSLYCELEVMPDKTCIKAGSLDEADVGHMQVEFYVKDRVSFQKPMEGAQQVPAFG